MWAPRARACSSDSRTSTAPPSPSTKPSRPVSQGRETVVGSPSFLDSAIMFAKAAIGSGWIAASVPPASTTSARPSRIRSIAIAIASLPDAQAEVGAWTAARAPYLRLTLAAGALGMSIGYGEGRDATRALLQQRVVVGEQRGDATDARGQGDGEALGLQPEPSRPESAHASSAATMANWPERSSRRALTRSRTSEGSTATRPPILTGICSTQSSVRCRTPDVPASRASQVV